MTVNSPSTSHLPNHVKQQSGGGFDWREYYYAIRSRFWIVVLCVILFTVFGFYKASKQHWVYRARTVFFIEQEKSRVLNNNVADVRDDQIRSVDMINTLVDQFQGYPFALRVANRMKLAQDPVFLSVSGINATEISPEQAASILTGIISAQFRQNTRLIDIFATTRDPKLSEKIANAYAQEYLYYVKDQQRESTHSAATFLVEESERLRKKMRAAEEGMQAFRERERAASIESMLQEAQGQINDLSTRQGAIQAKLTQIDSDLSLALAHKNDRDELLRLPSVANDPKVAVLVGQLETLDGQLSMVKQRYRAKHPIYINLQDRINLTRQQLDKVLTNVVDLLGSEKSSLLAQQNAANIERDNAEKHLLDVTSKTIEYNDLKRELESDAALYAAVISRIKEVDMTKELAQSPLTLQEAAMGADPIGVDPQGMILKNILTGLALGLGVTIALHKLDASMKTVDQVELASGIVVVAAIPQVGYEEKDASSYAFGLITKSKWEKIRNEVAETSDELRRLSWKKSPSQLMGDVWGVIQPRMHLLYHINKLSALPRGGSLVVKDDRTGIVAESFRSLRASVAMNVTKEDQRSFLFTSALPSEGKSFCSANFSTTLAHQGLRTLLIDADLRKPSISRLFYGVNRKPGVSEVLLGRTSLKDAVIDSGIPDLSILTAGGRSERPSELLAGEPFRALIREALLNYDRVVVDSAPLLAVSDTLLISHSVDILCLVVRSFMTSRKMVLRATKLLSDIHVSPSGIVLNCLPAGAGAADYYYGRHYGSYGTYGNKGVYGSG